MEPWTRPPPDSIAVDPQVPGSRRAPYAERSGAEFLVRMRHALASPASACAAVPADGWYRGEPGPGGRREAAFRAASRDLRERKHGYLVVYESWTGYREHPVAGLREVDLAVVLYRDGKSHGKHVALTAVVDAKDRVQWTQVTVEGVVPQWDIAADDAPAAITGGGGRR